MRLLEYMYMDCSIAVFPLKCNFIIDYNNNIMMKPHFKGFIVQVMLNRLRRSGEKGA